MNNWTVILGAAAIFLLPYPEAAAGGSVRPRQCPDAPFLRFAPAGAHPALNPLPASAKLAAARTRRPPLTSFPVCIAACSPSLPPVGPSSGADISANAEWRQRTSFPRAPPLS